MDDQLKTLREGKPFLFTDPKGGGPQFKGAKPAEGGAPNPGGAGTKNPWSKEHFNLTEQGRLLREQPDLAKQLMAAAGK